MLNSLCHVKDRRKLFLELLKSKNKKKPSCSHKIYRIISLTSRTEFKSLGVLGYVFVKNMSAPLCGEF